MKQFVCTFMLLVLGGVSLLFAGQDKAFQLRGTISPERNGQYIYLIQFATDSLIASVDSSLVKNGKFRFKGPASEKEFAVLVCGSYPGEVTSCELILEGGKIQVEMSDTVPVVSGTPLNDLRRSLLEEWDGILEELSLIPYAYSSLDWNAENEEKREALYEKLYYTGFNYAKGNIRNAIGRRLYKECIKLYAYRGGRNVSHLDFYNLGNEEIKQDPAVVDAVKYREERDERSRLEAELRAKNTDPAVIDSIMGRKSVTVKKEMTGPYKDFAFCSVAGDSVSLSDLVGKSDYLLVEIWASWCAPCKALIPFLKELWQEYDRETLNIISISIDDTNEAWFGELEKQKMPWGQYAITNERMQKKLHELYEFTGIPYTLVIDKDGNIDSQWFYDRLYERRKK